MLHRQVAGELEPFFAGAVPGPPFEKSHCVAGAGGERIYSAWRRGTWLKSLRPGDGRCRGAGAGGGGQVGAPPPAREWDLRGRRARVRAGALLQGCGVPRSIPSFFSLYRSARNVMPSAAAVLVLL